ncbi:ComEA family DNA-binding protein [Wenyingzhuangia sp. IMCC45467]
MKFKKSHFQYSKSQRNGIFLLIIIAIALQSVLLFFNNNLGKFSRIEVSSIELQSELDSIVLLDKSNAFKLYPFNPNYLSDYKAYQLGMSIDEIDRLMSFRLKNEYINSSKQFQQVTKISDSLLNVISPYFKFPEWVSKKTSLKKESKPKEIVLKDINKATVSELTQISGIGEKRAQNIIKYRSLLGGYTYDSQLREVWGIPSEILELLKKEFRVLSKPKIDKININTATEYELSKVVYIDYKLSKSIVSYRNEVAEIQNLAELKRLRDFPKDKFHLISLYLHAD